MPKSRKISTKATKDARTYQHTEADLAARPEIGAQAHFKKAKPPTAYRFDSSLAPELVWDGQNPAREQGESQLSVVGGQLLEIRKQLAGARKKLPATDHGLLATDALDKADAALRTLKSISKPFLNWAGKAERLSFEVPTLPLFVHERLSTGAILETLKGHKRDKQEDFLGALFGSPERPLADQVLRAYEHRDQWVNRLILGDSLVVMNSLLRFESLGGQVQMIYIDPPYGVKFGSNFQPFVRKRDVAHNDDDDLTREPEMVQAYRDTWELGLHSYLTYLRDRLLLARELLAPSGSVFVQISDENLHHVREIMDEVFGAENFISVISFAKTTGATSKFVSTVSDFLLWYGRDRERTKFREMFEDQKAIENTSERYVCVETPHGEIIDLSVAQKSGQEPMPEGAILRLRATDSQGETPDSKNPVVFEKDKYYPPPGRHWSVTSAGMQKVVEAGRAFAVGKTLRWKVYHRDFPFRLVTNNWSDMSVSGFNETKLYVVQTLSAVVQRCLLMTTDPGDLVLDPTCGSGTTAYVAEQWGRRWITCDTSRVPLALARQRLLTATFDYYQLKDEGRGPAGGFVYERRQNQKGEEVGGIVPHDTLKSIANNEPPAEEVLVDRPEQARGVVRVTGPFTVEATIPTAEGLDAAPETPGIQGEAYENYVQRMLEVLRRSPVLRLPGNQKVTLKNIRLPAKTLALSAEAMVDAGAEVRGQKSEVSGQKAEAVAILFGPENGPLSERLVREAWDEAGLKHYTHLYVIGFAIDPKARQFIDSAGKIGVACTYLQATMDLQMGDLLKNMRSSQIFSVCGLPDAKVTRVEGRGSGDEGRGKKNKAAEEQWQVELLGLDTFDPVTMEADHLKAGEVPAWLLDTDYNGMVFRVRQAFFPRTGAWENLKKSLKVEFEDTVWDHLAGTTSAPFAAGEHGQIAVKVIDPRGNELLVVKKLEEST